RLRMKVAQQHSNGELSALLRERGGLHALDHDFVLVAIDDRHDVDLHAVELGDAGLLESIAQILVAVTDENDALGSSLGEGSERQLDGGGDVGVISVDRADDLFEIKLGRVAGRKVEPRPTAKNNDAGF